MKLFCKLVGVAGSAFPVTIDGRETVGDLKDAIKKKGGDKIACAAWELQLYLAKMDNSWLKYDEQDAKQLRKGICTEAILAMMSESNEMEATMSLNEWIHDVCKMPEPVIKQIHVLVVVPTQTQPYLRTLTPGKIWYGACGTSGTQSGVDPNDSRTLSRSALCSDIIRLLDDNHLVLVKSHQ